ncbi:hypothetical protein BDZ45DRAFT_739765 [Acephala macrosclerotiorum]|nr:hypothetical protein BDZ45DRAFT_739765 [Acephala macrosclerotiorum]
MPMSGFGFTGSRTRSGRYANPYKRPQQGEAEVLLEPLKPRVEKQSRKPSIWEKLQSSTIKRQERLKSEDHKASNKMKDCLESKTQQDFVFSERKGEQKRETAIAKAQLKESIAFALARDQLLTNATLQRLSIRADADKKYHNFRSKVLREMDLMAGESVWRSRLRGLDSSQAQDMFYPENKRRHNEAKEMLAREVVKRGGVRKCGVHGKGGEGEGENGERWREGRGEECFCVVFEFKKWGKKGLVERRVLNYCD